MVVVTSPCLPGQPDQVSLSHELATSDQDLGQVTIEGIPAPAMIDNNKITKSPSCPTGPDCSSRPGGQDRRAIGSHNIKTGMPDTKTPVLVQDSSRYRPDKSWPWPCPGRHGITRTVTGILVS